MNNSCRSRTMLNESNEINNASWRREPTCFVSDRWREIFIILGWIDGTSSATFNPQSWCVCGINKAYLRWIVYGSYFSTLSVVLTLTITFSLFLFHTVIVNIYVSGFISFIWDILSYAWANKIYITSSFHTKQTRARLRTCPHFNVYFKIIELLPRFPS